MAPPSQLAIATSAVTRLVKEEDSYHKELEQQKVRLAKLEEEEGDENKEYMLKQQRKAMDETNAIFPSLRKRINDAMNNLKIQLAAAEKDGGEANNEEVSKAREAIVSAEAAERG